MRSSLCTCPIGFFSWQHIDYFVVWKGFFSAALLLLSGMQKAERECSPLALHFLSVVFSRPKVSKQSL